MFQSLLFFFFVILAIVSVNLWHVFAGWFVRTEGVISGIFLLAVVLLLAKLLDPYWEP
jgi:hypothetical protein